MLIIPTKKNIAQLFSQVSFLTNFQQITNRVKANPTYWIKNPVLDYDFYIYDDEIPFLIKRLGNTWWYIDTNHEFALNPKTSYNEIFKYDNEELDKKHYLVYQDQLDVENFIKKKIKETKLLNLMKKTLNIKYRKTASY